nr:unnamed protein product [Callosobruchus chinensis]
MYYPDLEWTLRIANWLGVHPEKKNNLWQVLVYLMLLSTWLTIPFLTLVLLSKLPVVTIRHIVGLSVNFFMFGNSIVKLSTLFIQRSKIEDLISRTRNFWKLKNYKETVKSTRLIRNVYANIVLFIILRVIAKNHVGGKGMTFRVYRPKWVPRMAIILLEDFACLSSTVTYICFDVLIRTFLVLLQMQFEMLNEEFKAIYHNCNESSREEIDEKLRRCVDHHNYLNDFLNSYSGTFSTALIIFIGNITISLCVVLYVIIEVSSNINHCTHLIAGLNMIFTCYAWPAQAMMNEANAVRNTVYLSDWHLYSEHHKHILIVLMGSLKTIEVKAGGILRIDMEMFMMIWGILAMYYPDLEWFLTLANLLGVHPEKKGSVGQMLLYTTILCSCLSIPGLTIVMLSLMDHVAITDILRYLSNFTMFIHSMFKLSTLYFRRSQVLDLFERTRYRFWNIKDYDEMVQSTKWIRNTHAYFMIIYTVTAMIKPHMKGGRTLSFRIYTPESIPRMAVLLYEDFVIIAAISSLVAFDLLVRTFLVLAEAQFRMLNQEFLLIYDRHELDQGLLYQRIKKCVEHHSFLIDFMNRFSDIFSTALLLFVGNITLSLCICMYAMLQEIVGVFDHAYSHRIFDNDNNFKNVSRSFNINHWVHLIAGLNMIFTCYSWPAQSLMNQALMKLSTLFFRRKEVLDILQLTNTHFWEVDRNSEYINGTLKKTSRFRIFYVTSVYLFALSSVVKPHINGGMTFKCYKPEWLPRYVLLTFEDIISLAINSVFCCFDVLMMTLLTLAQVQFRMLNERIDQIYTLSRPERIRINMRECINHYNFLIDFTSRFKHAFSITLLLFVGNISISLCICMYVISTDPPLHVVIEAFLHLVAGLNMIYICYSAPAQALMDEANRVGRSIYFSGWYHFPSDSKDMLTFLIGTQKKYEISAGGIVRIDMEMFMAGLAKQTTLFINARNIFTMCEEKTSTFWKLDDTEAIKDALTSAKRRRNIFSTSMLLFLSSSLIKPQLTGGLTLRCYKPEWLPRFALLIIQDSACIGAMTSLCCFDNLIMTLLTHVQLQFVMLNSKIRKVFGGNNAKTYRIRDNIIECVDQYTFLLGQVRSEAVPILASGAKTWSTQDIL